MFERAETGATMRTRTRRRGARGFAWTPSRALLVGVLGWVLALLACGDVGGGHGAPFISLHIL